MRLASPTFGALLLVGTLAACGGDDGAAGTNAATTTVERQGTTTSSTAGGAPTASTDAAGGPFCDRARAQLAGGLEMTSPLMQSILTGLMNPSTAAQAREDIRAYIDDSAALAEDAPEEVRASMQVTLRATESILAALEAANYDLKKVDMSAITAILSDPEFAEATKSLETYFKDRCGFDLGGLPTVTTSS